MGVQPNLARYALQSGIAISLEYFDVATRKRRWRADALSAPVEMGMVLPEPQALTKVMPGLLDDAALQAGRRAPTEKEPA